jgi:hypothetical protein
MLNFIKKYKIDIIIILSFLILPFIFFNDSKNIGTVIFGNGDPNNNTLPLWDLIVKSIKSGEFPYWNKYIFSGFPLFANPQSNILYPISLIFSFIFPLAVAYNLTILIHYSFAGIFLYLFLNQYKISKFASIAGGIIFMFSGVMICHKGHSQMLFTLVWTPLILYFLEKYKDSRRYENILIAAIFYSISFFGGHPQIFFYASMVIFLFILYNSIISIKKNYYFFIALTLFVIGFLIIAFQLLPIYELTKNSVRSSMDYDAFSWLSYPKSMIPTLFFPFILGGGPSKVGFLGPVSYIETVGYFGIVTVPFLIFGFFFKKKIKYFWIFLLLFSFLLVLGSNTPFYKIMFKVPIYSYFRIPTRNWFEFGLAFSILSAFGFDYFENNFTRKTKKIAISILSIFTILILFLLSLNKILVRIKNTDLLKNLSSIKDNIDSLFTTTNLNNPAVYVPIIFITLILALMLASIFKRNKYIYILFILLIFLDLRFFGNYIEGNSNAAYIYKNIGNIRELSFLSTEKDPLRLYPVTQWEPEGCLIFPSRNIHYQLDVISGYDPLVLEDYDFFTDVIKMDNKKYALELLKNNNILSMLNTKYIIYSKQKDTEAFLGSISKDMYENKKKILDYNNFENTKPDLKDAKIESNKDIIIEGEGNSLKYCKFKVKIESNKNYLIIFEIKKNEDSSKDLEISNNVITDFYSQKYDSPDQEFVIKPDEIKKDFIKINKTIFSDEIPGGADTYFRIFTNSQGSIEIKNLQIYEVNIYHYNNYNVLQNDDVLILENKNVLPRFYFVKEVKNVDDNEETKGILWDENVIWNSQRFDPHETAIISGADFKNKYFNTAASELNIIQYLNNKVSLETNSKYEEFLTFSDKYYPGWSAFIDGKETEIFKTNGILKGIIIPEGKHFVEFRFVPRNFWVLLSTSLASFLVTIIVIVILTLKKVGKTEIHSASK